MSAERTLVLQSQSPERLLGWQGDCTLSVKRWAERRGYHYSLLGDEIFEVLPSGLANKYAAQPVVKSDLARLCQIQREFQRGYIRVIWCDADLLVFDDFEPPEEPECFGRECWLQRSGAGIKRFKKIHNAWMSFHRDSVVLSFYIDRASALLKAAQAPVVPQFIGPKLLTAWHNIAPFNVEERVGMLSPLVANALLTGDEKIVRRQREGHAQPLCAVNLSASCEDRDTDGVCLNEADYRQLIDGLLNGYLRQRLRGTD